VLTCAISHLLTIMVTSSSLKYA